MKVEVELTYREAPSNEEVQKILDAEKLLSSNPENASTRLIWKNSCPAVLLEFEMKTQAQYKVVDQISDDVQRWLMEAIDGITIRFSKPHQIEKLTEVGIREP